MATTGVHVLGDSYPGPRRTVSLVGDDGWQVTCTLAVPPYGSVLVFQRVREATAADCPAITVFSTHDDSAAWAAALDGRAPTQTLRTLAVDGSWVVPSLDHRPDTRVASIDVRIGTPANLAVGRFPVHSGFAAGYGAVHLPRPVDWDGNQAIPVEVVLRDARGHELRRCST